MADLVSLARDGRLRIPAFQRGPRWSGTDAALLFDSLVHGWPIGSLLLWAGGPPAPAGALALGPEVGQAPSPDAVRWLIDGRQRVVALVAGLTPAGAAGLQIELWFDPDELRFHPRSGPGPEAHWIEVWRLLDPTDLERFLQGWAPGTTERLGAVREAGTRIREYPIPCTVVEAADPARVRQVVRRTNHPGRALTTDEAVDEVIDAWTPRGGTLAELAGTTEALGWGRVPSELLLGAALVNEGLDPTRRAGPEHAAELLSRSAVRLQRGWEQAIAFLRDEAAIPHVRLLPYGVVLQILPAFFVRHPEPGAAARRGLVRWVWRTLEVARPDDPSVLRRALRAVTAEPATEEQRVRSLLAVTPRVRSDWSFLGDRFRADSGRARIALVALATLRPADLRSGLPLDLGALFPGPQPIATLVSGRAIDGPFTDSLANRTIHPPRADLADDIVWWAYHAGPSGEPLRSHAIDAGAADALVAGDVALFLHRRGETLERLVTDHFRRFSAWELDHRSDLS